MTNKHTGMFKAWYEDNVLSPWKKKKIAPNRFAYEKVKHVKADRNARLGRDWEHERIWDDC